MGWLVAGRTRRDCVRGAQRRQVRACPITPSAQLMWARSAHHPRGEDEDVPPGCNLRTSVSPLATLAHEDLTRTSLPGLRTHAHPPSPCTRASSMKDFSPPEPHQRARAQTSAGTAPLPRLTHTLLSPPFSTDPQRPTHAILSQRLLAHCSFEQAALAEPLSVLLHASRRAGFTPGTPWSFLVLGVGAIGLLACALAKSYGATRVVAIDINQALLDFARAQGFAGPRSRPTYLIGSRPRLRRLSPSLACLQQDFVRPLQSRVCPLWLVPSRAHTVPSRLNAHGAHARTCAHSRSPAHSLPLTHCHSHLDTLTLALTHSPALIYSLRGHGRQCAGTALLAPRPPRLDKRRRRLRGSACTATGA